MKIDIEELKKVKIDPDDVLIVKSKESLFPTQREKIATTINKILPNNKIIVLDCDLELILAKMRKNFDEVKPIGNKIIHERFMKDGVPDEIREGMSRS